jgi:hypothetical protein
MPDEPHPVAPSPAAAAPRAGEAAPFLSWTAIYLVIALSLAAEIAAFATITWIYR